ncbi:hypothetical protein ElyMa_001178400 [Elysia marginata]|uniref:VQ domain-containing protein n=1 Tax=Elysia marginata TaxID=1093978 RepID=A0AAV4I3J3_9GAST|nr:hypothetical protein ElyMa_001178400 [Elysia marginata]
MDNQNHKNTGVQWQRQNDHHYDRNPTGLESDGNGRRTIITKRTRNNQAQRQCQKIIIITRAPEFIAIIKETAITARTSEYHGTSKRDNESKNWSLMAMSSGHCNHENNRILWQCPRDY